MFVTGEPGIGKTTFVEAFMVEITAKEDIWVGTGQCIEHYGAGEAYMPVLEALGRLCRGPDGDQVVTINHADAGRCLQQALAIARRQQAKCLELRAAMSLSRLWQQQGQQAEAWQLLAQVYDWFTEGFDTADLQEARTLLEALQ